MHHWLETSPSWLRLLWRQWHHGGWPPPGHVTWPLRILRKKHKNKWAGHENTEHFITRDNFCFLFHENENLVVFFFFLPVRSLAKSGWFIRQWLANFTHSSLMGTWMSLNLLERNPHSHQIYMHIRVGRKKCFVFAPSCLLNKYKSLHKTGLVEPIRYMRHIFNPSPI